MKNNPEQFPHATYIGCDDENEMGLEVKLYRHDAIHSSVLVKIDAKLREQVALMTELDLTPCVQIKKNGDFLLVLKNAEGFPFVSDGVPKNMAHPAVLQSVMESLIRNVNRRAFEQWLKERND
jgi:hypothetical protein